MMIIKISILAAFILSVPGLFGNKVDELSVPVNPENKVGKKNDNDNNEQAPGRGITITKKWEMPKELTEISGLSYMDEQRFACVQDELGEIFIYNIASSSLEKRIQFGNAGDYEGLAVVNDVIWVLRADGKLFEVKNIDAGEPQVAEFGTRLTLEQDSEGLCYDKINNRLLIAIKGSDPDSDNYKGIYAFDLASRKMDEQPVFKIDLEHEVFTKSSGKKKNETINPSGIAIHPVTGDMYIVDGRNSKLLITDSAGTIKTLHQLNPKDFAQPEGISFNAKGDLFISNEGAKQPGNILQVTMDQ